MHRFSPARLAAAGLVLLAVAFGGLWLTPTDQYIFLPNRAHAVEPLVEVKGERDAKDGGGIYFVDVLVRKATVFERIFPGVREGSTLVPAEQLRPPGVSDSERREEELREMSRSQRVAAAVALRELGYKVDAKPTGARIAFVDPKAPAAKSLEASDVVVAVDGRSVRTPADLRRHIVRHRPGEQVRLEFRRGNRKRTARIRTIASPDDRTRPVIGVVVEQDAVIRLPLKVEIDSGDVGGPSAGLAFALDLLEELGRDVDHGHRVAATGSIELDGTVGEIGGVRQKTIGVRRSKIDVFLVPAGENAREARRYAGGLRIIPVRSFQQALRALATLPRKRQE